MNKEESYTLKYIYTHTNYTHTFNTDNEYNNPQSNRNIQQNKVTS